MKMIQKILKSLSENLILIILLISIFFLTLFLFSIFKPNKIDKKEDPVENRLKEIMKQREEDIKNYEYQIDSLKSLIGEKKVEYIYIQKQKNNTLKNYNYEKSIVNRATTSEQFSILSTNLKQLDSMDRAGYFEKP